MSYTPQITVGLITYNRLDMLKEALESVLNQSYENLHVLIGNDCIDVPVSFENLGVEPDERVDILNYPENKGETANMNHLLALAQGEWFTWLADDDVLNRNCFEQMVNAISRNMNANTVAVYSDYADGASLNDNFFTRTVKGINIQYSPDEFIQAYMTREIRLIGCYGLMKTDKLKQVGGIPKLGNSFGPYSDNLIPIRLAEHGNFIWFEEPLAFLRTHSESMSASSSEIEAYTSAEDEFLTELKRICEIPVINANTGLCVSGLVKWYADNEMAILQRNSQLNFFSVMSQFIKHQLGVNLSRLNSGYKLNFIFYIMRLLSQNLIYNSIKLIRRH